LANENDSNQLDAEVTTVVAEPGSEPRAAQPKQTAAKATKKRASKKAAAKPSANKAIKKATKKAAKKATRKAAKKATKKPAAQKAAPVAGDETAEGTKAAAKGRKKRKGALVIVESPAKANTIKRYLGSGFVVKASVGHVKDLPKKKVGVDVNADFVPEYEVISGKQKILNEIKAAARKAELVYLAPDPDREGEAIAWHIAEEIKEANDNIQRVMFNEITKKAINAAIGQPLELDKRKFESQQARRILDRLVGYEISPVLWSKVKRGLSAGRVQSVAVRLVAEREAEIQAFKPEEYWSLQADVQGEQPPPFVVKAVRLDGEKLEMKNQAEATAAEEIVRAAALVVEKVERKERKKNPPPPFITSKLQQEASSKLRFSPKKTMGLAQRLYEGIELGEEGPVGLITYMRTDSTRLSDDAIASVRELITDRYGEAYLPEKANNFRTKKSAQDAHEAIRPTATKYDPETVEKLFKASGGGRDARETADLLKLYTLIWNRFVGCQMKPALFDQTAVTVKADRVQLRATGQVLKFRGFLEVYTEISEDPSAAEEDKEGRLPVLNEGESLRLLNLKPEQHFTQPPPRFSEATLVKELEEKGIGRPSTYAAILSTVQDRGYVEKREARLHPTELGVMVNGLLIKSFPDIVSTDFTANMEEQLDKIEEGDANWVKLLSSFYQPFKDEVAKAKVEMRDVKREETPTDIACEKCESTMVIKWGRNGHFLACSGYPECKNTKEYERLPDGSIKVVETTRESDETCSTCDSPMLIRRGRFGEFLACSRYPDCKTTKPISLGIDCPREGCDGFLTEKRSRRGKVFYGCSNYNSSNCEFVLWDRPVKKACPTCDAVFLVKKVTKAGSTLRCQVPGCAYTETEEESEAAEAAAGA